MGWGGGTNKVHFSNTFFPIDNNRLLFLGATTYDVHRSIKNNDAPPTKEQLDALQQYLDSRKPPPSSPNL